MANFKRKFYGKVIHGKFVPHDFNSFRHAHILLEGQDAEVTIDRRKRQRSNQQNRYYHGVIVPILADHFGYTAEEMHEALKFEFLKVHEDKPLATVRSTASLSTVEWEEFMSRVREWSSIHYNVYLPEPNEVDY